MWPLRVVIAGCVLWNCFGGDGLTWCYVNTMWCEVVQCDGIGRNMTKRIRYQRTWWDLMHSGDTRHDGIEMAWYHVVWSDIMPCDATGYIGSGRQNWDGSGGTGAALRHYEETGRKWDTPSKMMKYIFSKASSIQVVVGLRPVLVRECRMLDYD